MFYNLSHLYLPSLVPPQVQNVSRYNLRNANNVQSLVSHTSQYFHSSVIRDWNNITGDTRNADTVESFKQLQILHTRIKTGCSALNNDLFLKNIVESPLCACRSGDIENSDHFFQKCMLYNDYFGKFHSFVM